MTLRQPVPLAHDDPEPVGRLRRLPPAEQKAPTVDQVDVVLGEWLTERPKAELAPIAVTARMSRLAQILQQRMERASSTAGLDWGQFLVLAALRGAGPPFRMLPRELHRLLLLSPAAVTNRLYRLETKGLVERTADPTDRRSLPVILTAQGLSTIDRAMAACVDSGRVLLAGVDVDELEATLRRLRDLLSVYEDRPVRRRRRDVPRVGEVLRAVPAPDPSHDTHPGTTTVSKIDMWPRSDTDLECLQRELARRAEEVLPWNWPGRGEPAIGGVFVSLPTARLPGGARDIAWAGAVVMEGHNILATATCTRRLMRPYHPGYLAVTVGPILEDVVHALSVRPDIIVVNAAGRDHVRGAGLAIQLGAALEVPTIGVTDRADIGDAAEPGGHRGDATPVRIDGRLVAYRIRTLERTNPIVAHAAWLTTPETARDIVTRTTAQLRLPEPVQRARQLSRRLRTEYERAAGAGLHDGIHT